MAKVSSSNSSSRNMNLRLFYKEANILHSLEDKRIVKLHAVCQSPPTMMLELVYFDFSPFGLERRVFSLKDLINVLSSEDGAIGISSSRYSLKSQKTQLAVLKTLSHLP